MMGRHHIPMARFTCQHGTDPRARRSGRQPGSEQAREQARKRWPERVAGSGGRGRGPTGRAARRRCRAQLQRSVGILDAHCSPACTHVRAGIALALAFVGFASSEWYALKCRTRRGPGLRAQFIRAREGQPVLFCWSDHGARGAGGWCEGERAIVVS
jgi:hypothetical protein